MVRWCQHLVVLLLVLHNGLPQLAAARSRGGSMFRQPVHSSGSSSGGSRSGSNSGSSSNTNSGGPTRTLLGSTYCSGGGPAAVVFNTGLATARAAASSAGDIPVPLIAMTIPRPARQRQGLVTQESSSSAAAAAAAAVALPAAAGSSASADLLQPASVCQNDPAFKLASQSNNTCRLFVYDTFGQGFLCTAWFIDDRHVVTAGHCSVRDGSYYLNTDNPGLLCCAFAKDGSCRRTHSWNMVKWVATAGYLADEVENNDGTVVEVAPVDPYNYVPGQPQRMSTYYPKAVPEILAYLDGYPARSSTDAGCENINQKRRYHTKAKVTPTFYNGAGGIAVEFPLAGCVGESGGRVMRGGPKGTAFGIQTFGWTSCDSAGRGNTGVTQITFTAESCGVCVPCLRQALIDSGYPGGSTNITTNGTGNTNITTNGTGNNTLN